MLRDTMMLLMVRRTTACLSAKKIPCVLCGSRFLPALRRVRSEANNGDIMPEFPDVLRPDFNVVAPSSALHTTDVIRQKQKRRAFDALVHWCGAHQQVLVQAFLRSGEWSQLLCHPPSPETDEAALHWLQNSTGLFTCGQSLLVCSFLSEVLICRLEAAAEEKESNTGLDGSIRQLVPILTNRIVVLLQRVTASEKLETQPVSILMSCVYGVHRLSRPEIPLLGEAEKSMFRTPAALIFALLHQLRGNSLSKLFQLDEQAAANVCLSFLFIADEEQRKSFLSKGDAVLVNNVLRLLVRHISPLTKNLEIPSQEGLVCLSNRSISANESREEPINSPSMQECVVIMQNISFSSATYRLEVLSYLLCVRRNPALYTLEEVRLLPALLQTVTNIRSQEARNLKAYITSNLPLRNSDPVLVAQLFEHAPVNGSRLLLYLESLVGAHLSPSDAARVVQSAGVYLQWETFQHLAKVAFGETFLPTVSSMASSKVLLNELMESVLLTLLARLTDCKNDTERHAMRAYLSQLVLCIDWEACTLPESPKLTLQRLVLLTKLSEHGFPLKAHDMILQLAEKTLDLESGSSMINTLRCVTEALSLVPDNKGRQRVLESMIRYNGTRSTSSVIRFLAFLAPLTTEYSALGCELVQQLLRLKTLNPFRLRHGAIEGVTKGAETFTSFVVHAINFLLTSEEWHSSTEHLREVISLWIQDYLRYVVDTTRKRTSIVLTETTKTTATPSTNDENGVDPHHGEDGDAPHHEHLERVLVCMLRAGVKVPEFFASELSERILRIEKEGVRTDGMMCRMNFPPPGHFVFCCKLDIPMSSPLSLELLEYLLTSCDCRILHHVIRAFLATGRTESQEVAVFLLENMRMVSHSLRLFLYRIDHLDGTPNQVFHPSTISSAVANTLRFIVGHLTKQERNQRVLRLLPQTQQVSQGEGEHEVNNLLMEERARLGELIIRSIAYLSAMHMKDLGLLLLDRLTLLSPVVADHLMSRLSSQMSEFSQVDLFYLVRKYPPAQNLVVKELQKYDISVTVDLNEHARIARSLPMAVNVIVIEAHLPKLSFQWCTRLLSALSAQHETIPLPLLTRMLFKLEQELATATPTDRNVALVVLQNYLKFDNLPTVDDISKNDGSIDTNCERRRLVEACCDQLLVLEGINSLETLTDMLTTLPGALHSVIASSLIDRVVQIILPTVLGEIDRLVSICCLLQKHKLLDSRVKVAVVEGFFLKLLRAETADSEGKGSDVLSTPPVVTYPLGNVLALALVLSDNSVFSMALCDVDSSRLGEEKHYHQNSNNIIIDSNNITRRALQAVRERYLSTQDRLMVIGTLVDHKDISGDTHVLGAVAEEICDELLNEMDRMTPSEFSRLLQNISRLRCWHLVKLHGSKFADVFRRAYTQADAHNRCVAFKALSPEPNLFYTLEPFMIPLLLEVVDVMSKEDVEMVLSAVLSLSLTVSLESLIDSIGTRMLSMVDQCRRSTLIRMLQCHANFKLEDNMLVMRLLTALEEQCSRENRLDATQVLTLLQAVIDLDVAIPSRLAITCFSWLEHHVDSMSTTQLGHAARLAVGVEMGYTASVHAVAMRALEQRDAIRSNAVFRSSVELLCDEFSAEIPWNLKAAVVRRRLQAARLNDYLDTRRQMQKAAAAVTVLGETL